MSSRPHAPALPAGRLCTLAEVQEQIAYDLTTVGVPRRSCRVYAATAREARILGAVALAVDLDRIVVNAGRYAVAEPEIRHEPTGHVERLVVEQQWDPARTRFGAVA